jgi:hypothetical protein
MQRPLIHIGYPKTGSTWLQFNLFWNEQSNYYSLASTKEIIEDFSLNDPFGFRTQEIQEKYSKKLCISQELNRVPILSYEGLSTSHHNVSDSITIANHLKQVFPTARIFIVIRNQVDCILSSYQQYIKTGGQGSLTFFLSEGTNNQINIFRRQYYLYSKLIACYASLFGRENVLILPFELFREDQERFLKQLMSFSDNNAFHIIDDVIYKPPVNPSYGYIMTEITRQLNFFLRPPASHTQRSLFPSNLLYRRLYLRFLVLRISQIIPNSWEKILKQKWVDMIEECVADYYCEDNRELVQWVNEDLEKFGYRM